jgi:hypothetical protein
LVLKLAFKSPLLPFRRRKRSRTRYSLDRRRHVAARSDHPDPSGRGRPDNANDASAGAVHVLQLADAEAGDHLLVVPARAGKGVLTPKRFVEMEALPTATGLTILPFTQDLTVKCKASLSPSRGQKAWRSPLLRAQIPNRSCRCLRASRDRPSSILRNGAKRATTTSCWPARFPRRHSEAARK